MKNVWSSALKETSFKVLDMDEITAEAIEKRSDNSKKKSFVFDVLTLAGGTTFAQILTILSSSCVDPPLWA